LYRKRAFFTDSYLALFLRVVLFLEH